MEPPTLEDYNTTLEVLEELSAYAKDTNQLELLKHALAVQKEILKYTEEAMRKERYLKAVTPGPPKYTLSEAAGIIKKKIGDWIDG